MFLFQRKPLPLPTRRCLSPLPCCCRPQLRGGFRPLRHAQGVGVHAVKLHLSSTTVTTAASSQLSQTLIVQNTKPSLVDHNNNDKKNSPPSLVTLPHVSWHPHLHHHLYPLCRHLSRLLDHDHLDRRHVPLGHHHALSKHTGHREKEEAAAAEDEEMRIQRFVRLTGGCYGDANGFAERLYRKPL